MRLHKMNLTAARRERQKGLALRLLILWLMLFTGVDGRVAAQTRPQPVIFDTDLGPDSDDAGALAMLHALVTRGEAKILGVICSTRSPWCAPAADAINTYYGRPDIPIGTLKGPGPAGTSEEWFGGSFNGFVAGRHPNDVLHGEYAEDAAVLYRRLLAPETDFSVAVVVVGGMTNVHDLLHTPPDSISSLSGIELVARKVRELSVMGGRYPAGSESNFMVDPEATRTVVDTWPTPITFSGFEVGVDLLTGTRLWNEAAADNPVRDAYHLWDLYFARRFEPDFDPSHGIWPHSSYDQTSVLYAVRGLRDYWTAVTDGHNTVRGDGANEWRDRPDRDHAYLVEEMSRDSLADVIEELMLQPAPR